MHATAGQDPLLVVIIDDNPTHADLLSEGVTGIASEISDAVDVVTFDDPAEALASLTGETRDCAILCDYQLGDTTALDWLPDFVRANHGPVLITTSCGSEQVAVGAFRQGASDYLSKTNAITDPAYLSHSLKECLRRHRLAQTVTELSADLRRANRELEYRNEQLRATTQAAHDFVDDVAHDFRTPLAVIKEFASIVCDGLSGPVNEEQAEHLRHIDHATEQLTAMIDDFLDSAKLRAGLLRLDRSPIAPSELYREIAPMAETRASAKGVEVVCDIPETLPEVFVDPYKAERILTNLIGNAIKFSPEGSCVVINAEAEDECWVRFRVADQGPGIPPEELESIFERFAQSHQDDQQREKGSGLGLSIAGQLAAMNLGRLEVESEEGTGSVFSALLPVARRDRLLRAYIRHLGYRKIQRPLAVIRCEVDHPSESESLRSFLRTTCQANDLIVGTSETQAIAVGASSEPDTWLTRLQRASRESENTPADERVLFRADLVGVWPHPIDEEDVLRSLALSEQNHSAAA